MCWTKIKSFLLVSALLAPFSSYSVYSFGTTTDGEVKRMDTVRTYLNFSRVDPAYVLTMADLELSLALGSTLVAFDDQRQMVAGLAEKWEMLPPHKIQFTLRNGLKWSDGTPVTAGQYKLALERAKRLYRNDLNALFDEVAAIEATGPSTLVFTTKNEITQSGILIKLTEPMYGLVHVQGEKLDLTTSVGPFFLRQQTAAELKLAVNTNWYAYKKELPKKVEIRRPTSDFDALANFEHDDWANLISGTSLLRSDVSERFKKKGYSTRQRNLDKVFSLYPSKRFLQSSGASFIAELSEKLDRAKILAGMSGYTLANQYFPRGYELHSSVEPKLNSLPKTIVPKVVQVIIPASTFSGIIRETLASALQDATGAVAKVEIVPLSEIDGRMKRGDFDILATAGAIADPNFEGAMSFWFEREPPFIQSSEKPNDFASQVRNSRAIPVSSQRAARMREILVRAQEAGHVLPLIHFSSLAIAKPGIDLSEIPSSDETVQFSKVRMR